MNDLYTTQKLAVIAGDDQAFIKMMLETFVNSCKEGLTSMSNHMTTSDLVAVGKAGHKLKPSIDTVAPWLSKQVREVEAINENNNTAVVGEFTMNLNKVLEALSADLAAGKI